MIGITNKPITYDLMYSVINSNQQFDLKYLTSCGISFGHISMVNNQSLKMTTNVMLMTNTDYIIEKFGINFSYDTITNKLSSKSHLYLKLNSKTYTLKDAFLTPINGDIAATTTIICDFDISVDINRPLALMSQINDKIRSYMPNAPLEHITCVSFYINYLVLYYLSKIGAKYV